MRKSTLLAATLLAATTTVVAGAPAMAAKAKVDLQSQGGTTTVSTGGATVTGPVTGIPFSGTYTAVLSADDGSLPESGVRESGTLTVTVVGDHGQRLVLTGPGTIEGKWPQPNSAVTHIFTGRYTVDESTVRRVRGTDGWFSVGLVTENRGYFSAFDS